MTETKPLLSCVCLRVFFFSPSCFLTEYSVTQRECDPQNTGAMTKYKVMFLTIHRRDMMGLDNIREALNFLKVQAESASDVTAAQANALR